MKNLLKSMHRWVNDYIKTFYSDDAEVQQGIALKELHTGYVTANCVELARYLNLSKHDVELSEIIGLFHDIGRFRQYSIYKTFNDNDSEDHANLGLTVIDELDFFNQIPAVDNEIIHFAIKNHNKMIVEPTDDNRKLLFAKIIRDADKLDIYRVLEPFLSQENAHKMPRFIKGRERADISPDFVANFVAGKQADYRQIRTNGDRKIVRLMWVYDVYFAWTMRKIVERGYIDKIISALPIDDEVERGIERLKNYVAAKCQSNDV